MFRCFESMRDTVVIVKYKTYVQSGVQTYNFGKVGVKYKNLSAYSIQNFVTKKIKHTQVDYFVLKDDCHFFNLSRFFFKLVEKTTKR